MAYTTVTAFSDEVTRLGVLLSSFKQRLCAGEPGLEFTDPSGFALGASIRKFLLGTLNTRTE